MKKFKEINDKNDPKMPLSLKNYILLLWRSVSRSSSWASS